ncbi:MAG: hypothetical protein HY320_11045 [Armatimonadetes bacterium]|nr:hypothetical protein [Armatimonadota bacterium]
MAAAFADAVAKPSHNGAAGYGGCLVGWRAETAAVVCLDYNTRAPGAGGCTPFQILAALEDLLRDGPYGERFLTRASRRGSCHHPSPNGRGASGSR